MEFNAAIKKNKQKNEELSLCTDLERSPGYIVSLKNMVSDSEHNMLSFMLEKGRYKNTYLYTSICIKKHYNKNNFTREGGMGAG